MNDYGYTLDYADYCSAWKVNTQGPARRQCSNAARHNVAGILYLCDKHNSMVAKESRSLAREMRDDHTRALERRLAESAEMELRREERSIANQQWRNEQVARKREQVVYFIRCERFVKIGISNNVDKRLKTIRTSGGSMFPRGMDVAQSVLLGTVPGGRAHETALHQQFSHLRHTGEWFEATPELTNYIKEAITS